MPVPDSLIGPLAAIVDRIIPDPAACDRAKLELIKLEDSPDMAQLRARLSAMTTAAATTDPWASRARPSFLYVMYAMILGALPMGVIAAFHPRAAQDIAAGVNAYLNGLPEPLYALFGTGYLGYAAMRQWGKVAGSDN